MKIRLLIGVVAVLAFGGSDVAPRVAGAEPITCEALGQVPLTNATVTSAESVQAGGFTSPAPANAQYRFDTWTTDNGQPQNGVRRIRFIVGLPRGVLAAKCFEVPGLAHTDIC